MLEYLRPQPVTARPAMPERAHRLGAGSVGAVDYRNVPLSIGACTTASSITVPAGAHDKRRPQARGRDRGKNTRRLGFEAQKDVGDPAASEISIPATSRGMIATRVAAQLVDQHRIGRRQAQTRAKAVGPSGQGGEKRERAKAGCDT